MSTSPQFEVTITYNGVAESVAVVGEQAVRAVLQHSLKAFGIQGDQQNFALFDVNGNELDLNASAKDAGISPGAELVLRPRRVRGGA